MFILKPSLKGFNSSLLPNILFFSLLFTFLLSFSFSSSPSHSNSPLKKITKLSISQIIDHPALNETRRGILDGLKQAGFIKGKNLSVDIELAEGKPALAMQIAQKFAGERSDIIIGIATISAQTAVLAAKPAGVPVVFASVTDPLAARLVKSLNKPGKPVTGVSNFTALKPQFLLFKKLVPNLKRLGIIYNPGEDYSTSLLEQSRQIGKEVEIEIIPVAALKTAEVSSAARTLVGKVDAIYINNDNTALAALETIIKVGEENKLPVFVSDVDSLSRGAVAALGPNQYKLGLQTAKMIIKILHGEDPRALPVEFPEDLETKINPTAAKKMGVKIPSELTKIQ